MPSDKDSSKYKANHQGAQLDLAKIVAQYQLQKQSTRSARQRRSSSCRETKAKKDSCATSDASETLDAFDRKPSPVESPKEMVIGGTVSSIKPAPNPFHQFNHEDEYAASRSANHGDPMKTKKRQNCTQRTEQINNVASHAIVSSSAQQIITDTDNEVGNDSAFLRKTSEYIVDNIDPIPKPKRPLSAYNLFFRDHRLKLLQQQATNTNDPQALTSCMQTKKAKKVKTKDKSDDEGHETIGFSQLGKAVSAQWKTIDPKLRAHYENEALLDLERYKKETGLYKEAKMKALSQARLKLEMTVDSETMKRYLQAEQRKTKLKRKK